MQRSIASTEAHIDDLRAEANAIREEILKLEHSRNVVSSKKASFFEDLAKRRNLASSASSIANVASAKRFGSNMQASLSSPFQSSIEAEFDAFTHDIDECMKRARQKLAELNLDIQAANAKLDGQRANLREQIAQDAARDAEKTAGSRN